MVSVPVRPSPLVLFFGLAFAISWAFWALAILAAGSPLAVLGFYGGGFGPLIAALITVRATGGSPWRWVLSLWRWRVAPGFWLFVLGFPVAMALAATGLFALAGGEVVTEDLGRRLALWGPTFLTVALIGGGNEEPGWRGFALPRLQERLSPVAATLVLGVLWALWHLPLLAVRGGGLSAFAMSGAEALAAGVTLVSITAHAFWYTWIWNRTGSVLLCLVLHAGYNAANGLFVLVSEESLHGADERVLLGIMTGLLLVSVAGLIAATRGRLGAA